MHPHAEGTTYNALEKTIPRQILACRCGGIKDFLMFFEVCRPNHRCCMLSVGTHVQNMYTYV